MLTIGESAREITDAWKAQRHHDLRAERKAASIAVSIMRFSIRLRWRHNFLSNVYRKLADLQRDAHAQAREAAHQAHNESEAVPHHLQTEVLPLIAQKYREALASADKVTTFQDKLSEIAKDLCAGAEATIESKKEASRAIHCYWLTSFSLWSPQDATFRSQPIDPEDQLDILRLHQSILTSVRTHIAFFKSTLQQTGFAGISREAEIEVRKSFPFVTEHALREAIELAAGQLPELWD